MSEYLTLYPGVKLRARLDRSSSRLDRRRLRLGDPRRAARRLDAGGASLGRGSPHQASSPAGPTEAARGSGTALGPPRACVSRHERQPDADPVALLSGSVARSWSRSSPESWSTATVCSATTPRRGASASASAVACRRRSSNARSRSACSRRTSALRSLGTLSIRARVAPRSRCAPSSSSSKRAFGKALAQVAARAGGTRGSVTKKVVLCTASLFTVSRPRCARTIWSVM